LIPLIFITSYRGVRCLICITLPNDAQLFHAEFTHPVCRDFRMRASERVQ
jgi:hypothetical protein